jgi:hypothetical protein
LDLAAELKQAAREGAHSRADRAGARTFRERLTPARCVAFALGIGLLLMTAAWIYQLGAFGGGPSHFRADENWGSSQHAAPLAGAIDVLVLTPGQRGGRLLSITNPNARPLRPHDQIRVQAELNRPAYVYLVWLDSQGEARPVYPWTKGRWSDRPARQLPVARLSLPDEADKFWTMKCDHAGMETLVLLARETPLPDGLDLRPLFAGLPTQPVEDPKALVIFDGGKAVRAEGGRNRPLETGRSRGPVLSEPVEVEYPLVRAQAMLAGRLGARFIVHRAVSFACVEKN